MNWQQVVYGPWSGYKGSVAAEECPRDFAATGSFDYDFSPAERKFVVRKGQAVVGDTFGALVGILRSKFGAIPRYIVELESPSISDGLPTHMVIYTDETDKEGVVYVRDGSTNYTLCAEYGTTHYPVDTNGATAGVVNNIGEINYKVPVLWSENATYPLTRGTTEPAQRAMFAGGRNCIRVGNWFFFPNLQSTPAMWKREYNSASGSGSNLNRIQLWGHKPPLFTPTFVTANLPSETTTTDTWLNGDKFYVSVAFIFEDGSVSRPYIPSSKASSARSSQFVNDYGLVTIPGTAGSFRSYVPVTQIPKGPPGTVARAYLRSPKVNGSDRLPDPSDLRLVTIINDNTTVQFNDYNGNDLALPTQEEVPYINFRGILPWRARYCGAFDGRVGLMYLKPPPAAIHLAPTGQGTTREFNLDDTSTSMGAHYFFARITGTDLQLRYIAGASIPGAPSTQTISLTGKTLQDLVDTINATTTGSTAKEWAAQLAEGADPNADATKLQTTDAYALEADASIVSDATIGNMRGWTSLCITLYFTKTYLDTLGDYKDGFMHTESGPALKQAGVYSSAMTFAVGPGFPLRPIRPPEDAGIAMGMWPLSDGVVLFYSKSVWLYRNQRGGTTGEDFDYRLYKISNKGCIAWNSICGGSNNAVWLSDVGLSVTDGTPFAERIISRDLYDPDRLTGDLAYEIVKCREATAKDNDGARFCARVIGDKLEITYRSSSATSYPNRLHRYDFGKSIGASGVAQMLDPETNQPFGWSCPMRQSLSVLGAIRKDTALYRMAAVEESTSGYVTGDGRVDRYDNGTDDNGTVIATVHLTRADSFHDVFPNGASGRKRCRRVTMNHIAYGSGIAFAVLRSIGGSFRTYSVASTATNAYEPLVKRMKLADQTPSKVYQFKRTNDGSTSADSFRYLVAEVRCLDTKAG